MNTLIKCQEISGIVVKIISYYSKFHKLIVLINGTFSYMIFKEILDIDKVQVGSFIYAKGYWKTYNGVLEFFAADLFLANKPSRRNVVNINEYKNDCLKIQRLAIRSHAARLTNEYLTKIGYLPVQSPTIVSNWVDGRTEAFPMKYYKKNAYLSISNMLYHQIMLANGMNKIYELGKLHRMEKGSGKHKLCEFTILDISKSFSNVAEISKIFENVINYIANGLRHITLYENKIIPEIKFDHIAYSDLVRLAQCNRNFGSQLPHECKSYLNKNFRSFVWVTGFPIGKRPFYSKVERDSCNDTQLWCRGEGYFAAGTEIEEDIDKIIYQMKCSGKNSASYMPYINRLKVGYPPMTMIGLGFEMLLSYLTIDGNTSDYTWFPRYKYESNFF